MKDEKLVSDSEQRSPDIHITVLLFNISCVFEGASWWIFEWIFLIQENVFNLLGLMKL